MRKNSIKNTRVNTEVMHELSSILCGGIKDPRVAEFTSVVAVEVAPDLKTCKAYISVLGDEKAQADTIKGLQSAEGYIRETACPQSEPSQHSGDPVHPGSVDRVRSGDVKEDR